MFNKSGFVSARFTAGQKQRFVEGSANFKKHPANDGPPYGFDYDPILLTQDDDETDLKNIDKISYITIHKTRDIAEVKFSFPASGMKYRYILKYEKSKWLIDSMENNVRPG